MPQQPEIMIPLTSTVKELELLIPQVRAAVQQTFDFHKAECPYLVGTMIGQSGGRAVTSPTTHDVDRPRKAIFSHHLPHPKTRTTTTTPEIPRACLTAGEIAPLVDFFSFGTNGGWVVKRRLFVGGGACFGLD